MFLEGAANNHQWRRVYALASLVISLSSQPAKDPSLRQGGRTFAPPEQPMRRPLGLVHSWRSEGAGCGKGTYIMQVSNGQQVPVQLLGLV